MAKQHSVQVSNLGRKTAIRGRSLVYLTCIRNEERPPGFHSISLDCKGRKLCIILLFKGIGVVRPKNKRERQVATPQAARNDDVNVIPRTLTFFDTCSQGKQHHGV